MAAREVGGLLTLGPVAAEAKGQLPWGWRLV